jgi:DNA-3-methyladenine glycosylase I
MVQTDADQPRCPWATGSAQMIAYHDNEWGVPCHDDQALFERLVLESFQAGLSWATILQKREHFRRAFADWDIQRIAAYNTDDVAQLMQDASIIRNRRKIEATIQNARCFLAVQQEMGMFDRYIWEFVGGQPLVRATLPRWEDVPAHTPESTTLARDLRQRGFKMVGPTMCYALMQSIGMVNDHIQSCFRAAGPICT